MVTRTLKDPSEYEDDVYVTGWLHDRLEDRLVEERKVKSKETRYNNLYMRMAYDVATMSHARRKKVGCIIVKDGNTISMGWNGMPSGYENCCEQVIGVDDVGSPTYKTNREVLHAEANALMKLAKSTNSSEGATMYITCSPCFECAKLIHQAGISKVIYAEEYRDKKGVDFLRKSGIIVNNDDVNNIDNATYNIYTIKD
tara:strand:+ start:15854 stop:16450 length:597 start_codon:yes stop_codon:yes gene_type:complete